MTVATAAATGAAAAWAVAGLVLGLSAAYCGLLAWATHRATLRQWDLRARYLPDSVDDFLQGEGVRTPLDQPIVSEQTGSSLARFLIADTAGWLLAPMVFVVDLVLGRTPADSAGQRWLAILHRTQEHLRDRSVQALAVGAVTTAGVAAAGVTGTASAAPLTAAAPVAASAPARAAAPVEASVGATYVVQAGDTLSEIAAAHGTTWTALASINHLANPNFIYPGEVLQLGGAGGGGPVAGGGGGGTYVVQAGDTLSEIAAAHGTTWTALASINHLANPNFIYPGEVLQLGGAAAVATAASAPAPAPAVGAPASGGAALAVRTAEAQIGKPYAWGGAGPYDFDCSGLVMYAWAAAGVSLPHYSVAQYEDTTRISESQLEPGDLVFYDTGSGAQPGHVTMYIGNGQVITADTWGTPVRIVPLGWDGPIMGFGRV